MAKNESTPKQQETPPTTLIATPPTAPAEFVDPTVPPRVAPPPPGIFDQLKKFEQVTGAVGNQRHTFGAWARAKGVKLDQIRKAVQEGRLSGDLTGDGPEMTEDEFDHAVDFRYSNTFGDLPAQRIHVPAEVARLGGTSKGLPAEGGAADDATGGGSATAQTRNV
jgi:hypothetical protein